MSPAPDADRPSPDVPRSRRRLPTLVGAVLAALAVIGAGMLVASPDGMRPALAAERLGFDASSSPSPEASAETTEEEPAEDQLTVGGLLRPAQLRPLSGGRPWRTLSTTDNTEGNGLALPCQTERYADPEGRGALLRTFTAADRPGQPRLRAWQLTELSATPWRAKRTQDELRGWFAGCAVPRMQLIGTQKVSGVGEGDGGDLYVLRSWKAPVTTYVVGVGRTGKVTTTTVVARNDAAAPDPRVASARLAASVNTLCGRPGTRTCAAPPAARPIPAPATGEVPGMVSEIDMPPVQGIGRPWVGTEPRAARQNFASTQCDRTVFGPGQGVSNGLTRAFVIPGARLPAEFGLTQTVGTLPAPRAAAFFGGIRDRVLACDGRNLGTEVEQLAGSGQGPRELVVWRLLIEISDQETVPYLMGIARNGTAVTQIGFYPSGNRTMGPEAFTSLVQRAQERLRLMPGPERPEAGPATRDG
ncbi:hypothetical protein K8W59_12695 [Nocardioides rotundus]|uniref:hypothetical protein n=1 Tax=Nocardioides rotundus TaxID=1774216 RepID=UPI001CBD3260|nr:hypothetical protein [Nocardioides rotundus]UAL28713.1 hypothetical protein K8W59_12695 [Nocardioides rotundus]